MPLNAKTQDMPPPGGYKPIYFKRVPAQNLLKGWQWFAGCLSLSAGSYYLYSLNRAQNEKRDIEMRSAKNVISVLLIAERDREFLKQLRRNRDEEAELMKNVEGWEVGTWYGQPIYHTAKPGKWLDPQMIEFYAHCDPKYFFDRADMKNRC